MFIVFYCSHISVTVYTLVYYMQMFLFLFITCSKCFVFHIFKNDRERLQTIEKKNLIKWKSKLFDSTNRFDAFRSRVYDYMKTLLSIVRSEYCDRSRPFSIICLIYQSLLGIFKWFAQKLIRVARICAPRY